MLPRRVPRDNADSKALERVCTQSYRQAAQRGYRAEAIEQGYVYMYAKHRALHVCWTDSIGRRIPTRCSCDSAAKGLAGKMRAHEKTLREES